MCGITTMVNEYLSNSMPLCGNDTIIANKTAYCPLGPRTYSQKSTALT